MKIITAPQPVYRLILRGRVLQTTRPDGTVEYREYRRRKLKPMPEYMR